MITDLWIENFKGIGKRQHIPLRPITLLFGANSSGKSSVLHALQYLREVICHRNCDANTPLSRDSTVSLGGFETCLHHGAERKEMAFRLRFRNSDNCRWTRRWEQLFRAQRPRELTHPPKCPKVFDFSLTLASMWTFACGDSDDYFRAPLVKHYSLDIDGIPLMSIRRGLGNTDAYSDLPWGTVNLLSPVWNDSDPSYVQALLDTDIDRGESAAHWRRHFNAVREIKRLLKTSATVAGEPTPTDSGARRVYFRLLETLEWEDTFESFSRLPEDMLVMSLREYFEMIRPKKVSKKKMKEFVAPIDDEIDVVLLRSGISSDSEGTRQQAEIFRLLAMISPGGATDQQGALTAINRLRMYVCRTEMQGTPDRANWAQIFEIDHLFGTDIHPGAKAHRPRDHFSVDFDQFTQFGHHINTGEEVALTINTCQRLISDGLEQITYIGPKRATVPRDLTSFNADQYRDDWGNGLGAWWWLLNCTSEDFRVVSEMLAGSRWLDTRYKLERLERIEMEADHDDSHSAHPENLATVPVQDTEGLRRAYDRLRQKYEAAKGSRPGYKRIVLYSGSDPGELQPQDLGEGITQVIPILAAIFRCSHSIDAGYNGSSIVCIEQPELHLHPSLAARLGDILLHATQTQTSSLHSRVVELILSRNLGDSISLPERNEFMSLIETHSEHLILRILRRIRQTTDGELPEHIPPVQPDDVCVLYVDNRGEGTEINRLRIDERGEFIDRWPQGFFRERAEELF